VPEWAMQLIGPLAGGAVAGLMMAGAIRAEVRSLNEKTLAAAASALRAHVRIDDHIDRHHVIKP
jgi:hypothetical protein